MGDQLIKIEKRNDVPVLIYFITPFIAIILTILGGGIIFSFLGFNPIEALKFYFVTPISNLYGLSELLQLDYLFVSKATTGILVLRDN